jgi:pSer/pThr/pTyr-binding forkhead associated (FHA) protein
MRVTVEIRTGLMQGYTHSFDGSCTIGRDAVCDLAISDDARVSRRHARLSVSGNKLMVEDMGSTNGVRIGNKRITTGYLENGQQFRVGRTMLLVTWI